MNRRRLARGVSFVVVFLSASFFVLCAFWLELLHPLIFDKTGNFRTDGIFKELSPALADFFGHLSELYSCVIPLVLFMAGIAGAIALRPAGRKPDEGGHSHRLGAAGIVIGGVANLLVLISSYDLFLVPPGTSIRPMGWAFLMFLLAGATFLVSLPVSLIALWRETPRRWGAVSLVLGLTPLPLAMALFHGLSAIIGYHLSE